MTRRLVKWAGRSNYSHVVAQLVVVLVVAFTLKQSYSSASVDELRWILAPTTFLVELITGASFSFETHAGYMSSDRRFLIAGSCAGVNFMIAAFLLLSFGQFLKRKLSYKFIPLALAVSYATTIIANTVRISTALQLQETPLNINGLSANQLHRLEGILIYFGFLLLLFLLSQRLNDRARSSVTPLSLDAAGRFWFVRQLFLPLAIYYATTLGMPLANSIYRREMAFAAFMEHSVFVLFAPLLLIVPLVIFRLFKPLFAEPLQ